jgi:MinD superfamily P-loop ATPase
MVELVRTLGISFGIVINKAHIGDREIYRYLKEEELELIGEIPFSKAYASRYASGDLFTETPEEIEASYQRIHRVLSKKGILQ